VLSSDLIETLGIPEEMIRSRIEEERRELARRERAYCLDGPPQLAGRGAILVDDGLATGATMKAAIAALRGPEPARIGVAVPLAAPPTCREIAAKVDVMICAETPEPFFGVGGWYIDFAQTTDDEVRELLEAARAPAAAHP